MHHFLLLSWADFPNVALLKLFYSVLSGLGSVRWVQTAAAAADDESWRWDQSQWTEEEISSKGETVKQKQREQASSSGHHQQPVEELRISIVRVQTVVEKHFQTPFRSFFTQLLSLSIGQKHFCLLKNFSWRHWKKIKQSKWMFVVGALWVLFLSEGPSTQSNRRSDVNKRCKNANFSLVNFCTHLAWGQHVSKIHKVSQVCGSFFDYSQNCCWERRRWVHHHCPGTQIWPSEIWPRL